eukprot:403333619
MQQVTIGADPLSLINTQIKQNSQNDLVFERREEIKKPGHSSHRPNSSQRKENKLIDSYFDQRGPSNSQQQKIFNVKDEASKEAWLEIGEENLCKSDVKESMRGSDGRLFITNYRIYFKDETNSKNELLDYNSIPYGYIQKHKFSSDKKTNWLELTTKDFRQFKFKFESALGYQNAIEEITRHTAIKKHKDLFTYDFSKKCRDLAINFKQFNEQIVIEQVMKEFQRMNIHEMKRFRMQEISDQYKIRNRVDLPGKVIIPNKLTDEQIKGSSSARVNGRFPILTYYNQHLDIAIWRSSDFHQPLSGVGQPSKISQAFEKMWQISNKYEKSKKKSKFLTKIEKSKWFLHIDNLIQKSFLVHRALIVNNSKHSKSKNALIYCQTGQAGSPIISSLAQIIIDPYYRTLDGFKSLILKDWIYFGHNFIKYNNLMNDAQGQNYEQFFSPNFILFLDCVHQLIEINPTQFQFNTEYLVYLAFHCFSNKFFEFVHLNPTQQLQVQQADSYQYQIQKAVDQTLNNSQNQTPQNPLVSVFSLIIKAQYINRLYSTDSIELYGSQGLHYQADLLKYWKGYFGRYQESIFKQQSNGPLLAEITYENIKAENNELGMNLNMYYTRINKIKNQLGGCNLSAEDLELISKIQQTLKIVAEQQ